MVASIRAYFNLCLLISTPSSLMESSNSKPVIKISGAK